jgi:hypothetical protein
MEFPFHFSLASGPAEISLVLTVGVRLTCRGMARRRTRETTMKRRAFMLSVGGAAAGMVLLPRMAFAEAGKIDWYTSSDQNILDFWTNVVKPKFEAANAGVTLNLVDGGDCGRAGHCRARAGRDADQHRPAGRLGRRL